MQLRCTTYMHVSARLSGRGAGQRRGTAVQQAGLPHWTSLGPVGPHPEFHQPATGTQAEANAATQVVELHSGCDCLL